MFQYGSERMNSFDQLHLQFNVLTRTCERIAMSGMSSERQRSEERESRQYSWEMSDNFTAHPNAHMLCPTTSLWLRWLSAPAITRMLLQARKTSEEPRLNLEKSYHNPKLLRRSGASGKLGLLFPKLSPKPPRSHRNSSWDQNTTSLIYKQRSRHMWWDTYKRPLNFTYAPRQLSTIMFVQFSCDSMSRNFKPCRIVRKKSSFSTYSCCYMPFPLSLLITPY